MVCCELLMVKVVLVVMISYGIMIDLGIDKAKAM